MSRPTKIIVFDTETTGFSPDKHEIVQLSYMLYNVKKQIIEFVTNPGDDIVSINAKDISEATSKIHGIRIQDTVGKKSIKEHIDQFIDIFKQADMYVAHNIGFDKRMIIGQINKFYGTLDTHEKEKYDNFLNQFRDPEYEEKIPKRKNNNESQKNENQNSTTIIVSPLQSYCTMENSKDICNKIANDNAKKRKLIEVHKLLFKEEPRGQLHNALVDISVTLRVFLKLTDNIDICKPMTKMKNIVDVKNNNDICNLIDPHPIDETEIKQIEYTGELITGLTVKSNGEIKEEKIMVESIYMNLATNFVEDVKKKAVKSVLSKIEANAQVDKTHICTDIIVCTAILKSGERKGQICNVPSTYGFCGYHNPNKIKQLKQSKQIKQTKKKYFTLSKNSDLDLDLDLDKQLNIPISIKDNPKSTATKYVNSLIKSLSRSKSSKIHPSKGGRKTRKNKKRIKIYKTK
jgi:DNA polymerase III epsilon subunit-like protein